MSGDLCPIHAGRTRDRSTSYRSYTEPMKPGPAAMKPGTPVLLGIPFDANSSWMRGTSGAPPIIRVALRSDSSNSWTETGVDLGVEGIYRDAGDLVFASGEPLAA